MTHLSHDSTTATRAMQQSLEITRRHFFDDCRIGLGRMALGGLLASSISRPSAAAVSSPMLPKEPHFAPQAKRVVHLFMTGAPSQLDLFDEKPALRKLEGKPLPPSVYGSQRYAFIRPDAAVLGPRFSFQQHGESGANLAEPLVHLPKIVDEIAIVKSVHTDQFNHAPAQIFLNTGFAQPGRPSLGSWVSYGLGSETENLPAFVVMSTGSGISGGSACWSSGYMPTVYSGVRFRNSGDPILHVSSPNGVDAKLQRDTLNLISKLNQHRLATELDPEIETRIASYEMAYRLQTSAPELMDLKSETPETLQLYGCEPDKPSFARACLLARRMLERGVRFINIYHEGWDAHSNVEGNVRSNCRVTDQASAALVLDLKQRGLLDDTLVIWGGEFGRTPMVESNPALGRTAGRDHHPQSYTMWLAGGGIRGGMTYGKTDDLGFHIAENPVHVRDLHATILHQLGFDHERLTYKFQGLDARLTGVEPANVVHDLLR